jgi:hypothetical protein
MEFVALLQPLVWAFQPSAFYTEGARLRLVRDAGTLLRRIWRDRVRAGYHPNRCEYLHRACCDVADLLMEVGSWLTQWPASMAVLAVAAEGAHLLEGILEFSYSPELLKHVSSLFNL